MRVWQKLENKQIILKALIFDVKGEHRVEVEERGDSDQPELVGAKAAGRLLHDGGSEILLTLPSEV